MIGFVVSGKFREIAPLVVEKEGEGGGVGVQWEQSRGKIGEVERWGGGRVS